MVSIINDQNEDMYYVSPEGITVQGRTKVYETCAERDSDTNPPKFAWVIDASDDPTVDTGSAYYYRKDSSWKKLYESEALDNEIFGKPEGYDDLVITVNQSKEVLQNHIDDSDIHVSIEDRQSWNNKVDQEPGKGLSTNDFTNEDKSKLDQFEPYDDTELRRLIDLKFDESAGLAVQNRVGIIEEEILGIKALVDRLDEMV